MHSLLLALFLVFGCASKEPAQIPGTVALPAPLEGISLPAEGITATPSAEGAIDLDLDVPRLSYKEWTKEATKSLVAQGWTEAGTHPIPQGLMLQFTKDGQMLSVLAGGGSGKVRAHVSLK